MAVGPKKLIFITEDDEAVRKLLERALFEIYTVESFADGLSTVKRFESDPLPDLFICDIMIPGVDGLSLAKRLKADPRLSSIPIVFLTARTTAMDVIQGIQAGARHYVTKPFKLEELLGKIRKILGA